MKKLLLLFCAALTVVSLQAQDHKDDKPSKITFIGGWNYAKYVSDTEGYGETDYKSGLFLGINKDVKITPFVWANGGLLYYQNGADTEFGSVRLDYLMIPVGLKLRFGPVYAMGGVYGAYRLSANVEGAELGNGDFNRLDFGTYAGAGFKVLIFSINAKYNWGLSDVSNGKNGVGMDVYNRFFSISLGVGIP